MTFKTFRNLIPGTRLTWSKCPSSVMDSALHMSRISAIATIMMITLAGGVPSERR
jgi:hypothetical protein